MLNPEVTATRQQAQQESLGARLGDGALGQLRDSCQMCEFVVQYIKVRPPSIRYGILGTHSIFHHLAFGMAHKCPTRDYSFLFTVW
jgi:hypothetical protein